MTEPQGLCQIAKLNADDDGFLSALDALTAWGEVKNSSIEKVVVEILGDVRMNGDKELVE